MRDRGLLTDGDRDKLEAIDDISDLDEETLFRLRSRWNTRLDNLETDLEMLREVDEEETLAELQQIASAEAELERRVTRLEQLLLEQEE